MVFKITPTWAKRMLGSSKVMMIDPEASISSHGRNIALSVHLEQVMTVCDTVMPAESKTGVSCKSHFQDENLHRLATELRSQPGLQYTGGFDIIYIDHC